MTCFFEWWRVQSCRTGPPMETQGLEIFLFSSDLPSYCTEVSIKTDCERHTDKAAFCELTQLPWTLGFCTRTHILRNSSGSIMPGLQPQSRLEPCASPCFSLAPSRQTRQFARLVCGLFPAGGPWLVLTVWQDVHTDLSGDTDLDHSASFRRSSSQRVQL